MTVLEYAPRHRSDVRVVAPQLGFSHDGRFFVAARHLVTTGILTSNPSARIVVTYRDSLAEMDDFTADYFATKEDFEL